MRNIFRPLRIRWFIIAWISSVMLAWLILVIGWFMAKQELSNIGDRLTADIQALEAARQLEAAILAHRREELLWESTGNPVRLERSREQLALAEQIARELPGFVTTAQERALSDQILSELPALRDAFNDGQAQAPPGDEAQVLDEFLSVLRNFRLQNERQATDSIAEAGVLHRSVTRWMIAVALITALLLALGALNLVRRIVRPVLVMSDAAERFGQGNFETRAPVVYDDELGALARTFNNMAGDVADREQERLRFVAMVVHDLKTPVLAIEMVARMWNDASPEEQQMYLEAIGEEAARLNRIIRDLTDDVQVASGRLTVNRTDVDLGALVKQLIEAQSRPAQSHRVKVSVEPGCMVSADPQRIDRVLSNLMSNAMKYSPRDTQITVKVQRAEHDAVLTITDQGSGISADEQEVIFQPFGRGRQAHSLAEGTGMGLYVVKQIVEAHDGSITVHSEPGRGTTFEVRLPLLIAAPVA